jgi:hypothetical protein
MDDSNFQATVSKEATSEIVIVLIIIVANKNIDNKKASGSVE